MKPHGEQEQERVIPTLYTQAVALWRLSLDNTSLIITQQIREREIEPIARALSAARREEREAILAVVRSHMALYADGILPYSHHRCQALQNLHEEIEARNEPPQKGQG